MTIEENIKKQNILLPEAPNPVGAYLAYKKTGSLVYISGQISLMANGKLIKGKIGSELTLDQGIEAAQVCAINIISQVKSACQGDLENVKNLLSINDGETFNIIYNELYKRGYNISYKITDSKYYNSPQSRQRLFIICNKINNLINFTCPVCFILFIY